MTLTIGHFSDLHGNLECLTHNTVKPDLWVCTGDFFPNASRGIVRIEEDFQKNWFLKSRIELNNCSHRDVLVKALGGIELLWLPGNHDFVSLAELLQDMNYPAQSVTPNGIKINDIIFAGFREIPYINGEWKGESAAGSISDQMFKTLECNPNVLVTHCPPAGILDGIGGHYGAGPIRNILEFHDHKIKYHLYGHCHESRGFIESMGIKFYNSATTLQFIEVSL